jgi:hypothetical protein
MASLQRVFQSEIPEQRKRRLHNERQAAYYRRRQTRQDSNVMNLVECSS